MHKFYIVQKFRSIFVLFFNSECFTEHTQKIFGWNKQTFPKINKLFVTK